MPGRILLIQYGNPAVFPPVQNAASILADRGWKVSLRGVVSNGTQALDYSPAAIDVSLARPPARRHFRRLQLGFFTLRAIGAALRMNAQWIYVYDPPATMAGLMASYLSRANVVYHEHDPFSPSHPGLFRKTMLRIRDLLARRAKVCVLPNVHRARTFEAHTSAPNVVTVLNCPLRAEADATPSNKQRPRPRPLSLIYVGTIVPERLPLSLLRALGLLHGRVRLDVLGYEPEGAVGYGQQLKRVAADLEVSSVFSVWGPTPADQTKRMVLGADVGVSVVPTDSDDASLATMAGASNKTFEYLAAGVAVLVPDEPEWRSMFVDPGYGRACDPADPVSIADALELFAARPNETQAMGEAGRQKVLSEWNYETQFASVVDMMEAL